MMASSQQAPGTGGPVAKQPFTVRLSGHFGHPYRALDYLRAVDPRDLPQTIRDCLNNNTELTYYIANALFNAPIQRYLTFRKDINPGNHRHFSTLRPWYNVHALFVYVTGNESDPPCMNKLNRRIKECDTIFQGCIVPRDDLDYGSKAKFNSKCHYTSCISPFHQEQGADDRSQRVATACANHQYQCEGSRCLLNGVAQTQSSKARSSTAESQNSADEAESTTVQAQPAAPVPHMGPFLDPTLQTPGSGFFPVGPQFPDHPSQHPEDGVGQGSSQVPGGQDDDVFQLLDFSGDLHSDPMDLQSVASDHQTTASQAYSAPEYPEPHQVNGVFQNAQQPYLDGMENVDPHLADAEYWDAIRNVDPYDTPN